MEYKPAFMLVADGQIEVFMGNYDNLADLRADYPTDKWVSWSEKDRLLFYLMPPEEYRRRQIKCRNPYGSLQWWLPAT